MGKNNRLVKQWEKSQPKPKVQEEPPFADDLSPDIQNLTAEQIVNWRRALIPTFGAYALVMPDRTLKLYADRLMKGLL